MENEKRENPKISRDELFSLLSMFMGGLPSRWEKYQNFITIYTTIILSILGVTIVGLNSFKGFTLLYLLIAPLIIIVISSYAKQTIVKQSKEIREYIAMIGKISFELGLYENIRKHNPLNGKHLWEEDDSFILPRWVKGRMDSGKTSEEFITEFGIGGVKQSFHLFNVFIFISIVLILFILIEAYNSIPCISLMLSPN